MVKCVITTQHAKCVITTQHAKQLQMDCNARVMAVRVLMTVNNHTTFIQKDNIGNLHHQINSHGLRKTATHVYSYEFSLY